MAITKASEHTPTTPLEVYCSPDDVRVYLAGVAVDDDGSPFEALLSRPRIDESLTKWSKVAKKLIDRHCGRDFDLHEDVDIAVDGPGSDVLDLKELGFVPLIDLTALKIDDDEENLDDYLVYTDDAVIARTTYQNTETHVFLRGTRSFIVGRQNVEATISWGYESVPIDVEAAAAYWTGALLLNPLDAATDNRAPGVNAMARSVNYGDLRIDLGATHPGYFKLAERLKAKAKEFLSGYTTTVVLGAAPGKGTQINEIRRYYSDRVSY